MSSSPDPPWAPSIPEGNTQVYRGSPSGDAEQPTATHSGTETPSGTHGGKKRVNWVLPSADEEQDGAAAVPNSGGSAAQEITETISGNTDDGATPDLEPQITNEELRNQIHQIFSQHASTTASRDSPDRQHAMHNEPPRGHPQPGKSALRKGHVTPGGSSSPSPPATEQQRQQKKRKTEAAADAHRKAHWWSRSVDTSPEPPMDRSRAHRRPRPALYHKGDDFESYESGTVTPDVENSDYVAKPGQYRVSGLSAIGLLENFRIRLGRHYGVDGNDDSEASTPSFGSRSLPVTPRGSPRGSVAGIGDLIQSSSILGGHGYSDIGRARRPDLPRARSSDSRYSSSSVLNTLGKIHMPWKANKDEEIRIKEHVQETILRQRYLLKLCHALMMFGAPTHRLEQYMKMSARVLETEAQFLYIPGCMIISFDDTRTHTTEVKLVRNAQGIDLGKMKDTYDIYKDVVHDHIGVNEALERLDGIIARPDKFNKWLRVLMFGLASVGVGPFAFSARLIDLPIAFLLGCILGFLQLIAATKAELYANVFEIMAVMINSFLARAFGSIHYGDKRLFCFSALAQSSIAMILPGYLVLCGSLELQSRSMVAGSVRLVYAIIYSLFIGYALTLGTAIYGVIDSNATSETVCRNPLADDGYWFLFFVPLFAICLMVINQAKYKQMPVMTAIACCGYLVSYFSSHKFIGNSQVTSTLAALTVGVLANLYSRVGPRLDSVLQRQYQAAVGKLPINSRERDTPSSLEKQTDGGDDWAKSSSTLHKFSGFLHRLQRNPKLSPSSSNDNDSSGNNTSKEKDKYGQQHYFLASAAMLPAIFVLVPSGLSVSGSLVTGIQQADQLVHDSQNTGGVATSSQITTGNFGNGLAFNVGYSVVQIAIGITVGLLFGSLVVYPFGKGGKLGKGRGMRSGLFSY